MDSNVSEEFPASSFIVNIPPKRCYLQFKKGTIILNSHLSISARRYDY